MGLLGDFCRSLTAATGLILAGWMSLGIKPVTPVFAQVLNPTAPSAESLPEFAIRQGGAFAILALVLFYYRRDYRDLTTHKSAREEMLVALITEHTKAQADMAATIRANNETITALRDFMAQHQIVDRRKPGV